MTEATNIERMWDDFLKDMPLKSVETQRIDLDDISEMLAGTDEIKREEIGNVKGSFTIIATSELQNYYLECLSLRVEKEEVSRIRFKIRLSATAVSILAQLEVTPGTVARSHPMKRNLPHRTDNESKKYIVNPEDLRRLADGIVTQGSKFNPFFVSYSKESFNISVLAAWMFCGEDYLRDAMVNYYYCPDASVNAHHESKVLTAADDDEITNDFRAKDMDVPTDIDKVGYILCKRLLPPVTADSIKYSENECLCFQGMIIFCMMKTFTARAQYDTFLARRVSSFCKSLSIVGQISLQLVKDTLPYETMLKLSVAMNNFPLFKSKIFIAIASSKKYPFCSHLMDLTSFPQMTTFNFIHLFISDPEKKIAHIDPTIIKEAAHFYKVWKSISERMGDDWPYYNFLHPECEETNQSNWPNLAKVALYYIYMKTNAASPKEVVLKDFKMPDNRVFGTMTRMFNKIPALVTDTSSYITMTLPEDFLKHDKLNRDELIQAIRNYEEMPEPAVDSLFKIMQFINDTSDHPTIDLFREINEYF